MFNLGRWKESRLDEILKQLDWIELYYKGSASKKKLKNLRTVYECKSYYFLLYDKKMAQFV